MACGEAFLADALDARGFMRDTETEWTLDFDSARGYLVQVTLGQRTVRVEGILQSRCGDVFRDARYFAALGGAWFDPVLRSIDELIEAGDAEELDG
jgi:hypothetical protein